MIDRISKIQEKAFVQLKSPWFQCSQYLIGQAVRIAGSHEWINLGIFVAADTQIDGLESKVRKNGRGLFQITGTKGKRAAANLHPGSFTLKHRNVSLFTT